MTGGHIIRTSYPHENKPQLLHWFPPHSSCVVPVSWQARRPIRDKTSRQSSPQAWLSRGGRGCQRSVWGGSETSREVVSHVGEQGRRKVWEQGEVGEGKGGGGIDFLLINIPDIWPRSEQVQCCWHTPNIKTESEQGRLKSVPHFFRIFFYRNQRVEHGHEDCLSSSSFARIVWTLVNL